METQKNKIAVIGAGVSGIAAMKYLKDKNLKADIFDSKSNIAGLWNLKDGFVWNEMTTNLSQYNNQFSDFFWPIKAPYLPFSHEVYNYIESYVKHNGLVEYHNLIFNSRINMISKIQEEEGEESHKYLLEVLFLDEKIQDVDQKSKYYLKKENMIYDYVIVCTGANNDFKIPEIENFKQFSGDYIHSSRFKNPIEVLKRYENILVVGSGSSSINIIEHLNIAKKQNNLSNKLTMCFRSLPFLNLSDFTEENTGFHLTNDVRFFKRKTDEFRTHYMDEAEVNRVADGDLKSYIQTGETQYKDLLPIFEKLNLMPGKVVRASSYKHLLKFVRNQDINFQANVKKIIGQSSKEIEFADGERENYDLIIFGTGYNNNLNFIDKEILNDLDYYFDNYFFPLTLYKGIFHNKHKGLFFLGTFCRQYITGGELQAEYISSLISKEREYPTDFEFEEIIKKEKLLKEGNKRLDVPWFHPLYWDTLAYDLGCLPNFQLLKEKDKELYDVLMRLPIYGFQYRLFKNNEFVEEKEYQKIREYIMNIKHLFK